ncbi:hypothetical protein LJR027_000769 [Terrabacter sp. LjRoot27]|uniref:hypothetical protein n=1 Tax=Terrabacter sp. LjRoot27 TaxID=3342306 RepID=UPI003ED165FE
MRASRVLGQVVAALAVLVATVTSPSVESAQASPPSGVAPRSVPTVTAVADPVWSAPVTAIPDRGRPSDVSCPTTTWCMAVDLSGRAMTFNGSTWTAPKVVFPRVDGQNPDVRAVSCPTTTFCLAVSASGYGVYRSGTWTVVPSALAPFRTVSCYSSSRCAVVAGNDQSARRIGYWNGSTITGVVTAPWASRVDAVVCPSAAVCHGIGVASTGAAIALRSSGAQWVASFLNQTSVDSTFDLSCTSATFCLATSGTSYRTWRWNGTSWRYAGEAQNGMLLEANSLSCTSATSCHAVGDRRVGRWNGSTWSIRELTTVFGASTVVDCATSTACVVVDDRGRFQRGSGSTWTPAATFDPTSGWVTDLSCPTATFCMAADDTGNVLRWTGTSWTAPGRLGVRPTLVSCVSATWCMTVDSQQGAFRTWTGAWGPATPFDSFAPYGAVACGSSSLCFLFQGGEARRWNGRTWASPVRLFTSNELTGLACRGSNFCIAMTRDGSFRTWNGSMWSAVRRSGQTEVFDLTCVSPTFCMLSSGAYGSTATFNGSTWTVRGSWPSGLGGWACQSSTRCVGLAYDGVTWVWDGRAWAATNSRLDVQPYRITCVPTRCMVVGYEKSSWTL